MPTPSGCCGTPGTPPRRRRWTSAEPATAVAAATAAVDADPFDEAGCPAADAGAPSAGEPARALAAYARLRAVLADELGTEPAAETRALHVALLREEPAPAPSARAASGAAAGGLVGRDTEVARLAAPGRPRRRPPRPGAGHRRGRHRQDPARRRRSPRSPPAPAAWCCRPAATGPSGRCSCSRWSTRSGRLVDRPARRPCWPSWPATDAGRAGRAGARGGRRARRAAGRAGAGGGADAAAAARVRRGGRLPAPAGRPRPGAAACSTTCRRPALATVELLHYLARHAGDAPLLVVATVRSEEGEAGAGPARRRRRAAAGRSR